MNAIYGLQWFYISTKNKKEKQKSMKNLIPSAKSI